MITKQDIDELARIFANMTAPQLRRVSYVLYRAVEIYETSQYLDAVDFLVKIHTILSEPEADGDV